MKRIVIAVNVPDETDVFDLHDQILDTGLTILDEEASDLSVYESAANFILARDY